MILALGRQKHQKFKVILTLHSKFEVRQWFSISRTLGL